MILVGRETELDLLRQVLDSERVVTVWGPAGVGKTRLVREALGAGVPVCSLVRLRERGEVLEAVARALDVARGRAALDVTVARAVSRAPRVVLDGCDRAAAALAEIVPAWPDARVVLTARSSLGIASEHAYELAPLDTERSLELYEALVHGADPTIASAIIAQLDGLPQAIEWVASRAALLGERECLERLGARRLGTEPLTAALTEMLDALDGPVAATLELLCAFEDGASGSLIEPVEHVDALLARSLARMESRAGEPARIRAYRTVVDTVRARAAEAGTWEQTTTEHARLTLQRVSDVAERAELEVVAARFAERDPELAARACVALVPVALASGSAPQLAEGLAAALPSLSDPALRRAAQLSLARIERRLGHLDVAEKHLAALDDEVDVLIERAHIDRQESRLDDALAAYRRALEMARGSSDRESVCTALGELGRMLQSLGRLREAQEHHVEAIALARALGLAERETLERSLHARATHRAGAVREAIPLHESALASHVDHGDRHLAAAERGHLAFCHHEVGELDEAERSFRESIEGLADAGDVVLEHIERVLFARLLADRGRCAEARLELAMAKTLGGALRMPRLELTWRFVAGLVDAQDGRIEDAISHWREGRALGALFEVGFETLLPAWLAWGERDASSFDTRAVDALESPGPKLALNILEAAVAGEDAPVVPDAVLASSSDVRRALRLTGAASRPALQLALDARFARLPDGSEVDLSRRNVPRRILSALADARRARPGEAVSRDQLIEAGWPGERMRQDAADKRLRTAIWTLRKAGFEALLLTRDDGYLLDPFVPLRAVDR